MLHVYVYTEVAVVVRHWFEVSLTDSHLEHGARIELRLLDREEHRGTESASQKIVADRPVWRADLFDRLDGAAGGFEAAHFHPRFAGVEPSERNWADEVKTAPWEWLHGRLSEISEVAATGGVRLGDPEVESGLVRADATEIVAAARSRAGDRCASPEQCYAWTRDAEHHVHLMLGSLERPDLLDRDYSAPWRRSSEPA